MSNEIKAMISTYCYMVQRGKPAALVAIQERYIDEVKILVEHEYQLKTEFEKNGDGWYSLYIYKYDHILDVIKNLPNSPQNVFEHWVLGKLFGYDEQSIAEFIKV